MIRITLLLALQLASCWLYGQDIPLAKPQSKGFSPARLDSLSAFLDENGSSALIIMVDGEVVYQWGAVDEKLTVHSIRKALLNSLYGIKVAQGVIDTSATLRQLGINDIEPALSKNELDARIADLLKSRSGVYHDAAAVSAGMLRGKPARDTYPPGEHFYYNNWDFNLLGAILEQQTGQSIYQLFLEEIARPLGMQDYAGVYDSLYTEDRIERAQHTDGFYQYELEKSKYPAYHFRLSARDMARYGQLYLNQGNWQGQQLLPEEWVEASTRAYSVTNPKYGIGYGMLWYVLMPSERRSSKSFYHTGTGVHMLGVYPESNMVLVHRVNTEQEFRFREADFYRMISLVFSARVQ